MIVIKKVAAVCSKSQHTGTAPLLCTHGWKECHAHVVVHVGCIVSLLHCVYVHVHAHACTLVLYYHCSAASNLAIMLRSLACDSEAL